MENSVHGKTFDMNKTLIYLLSVGNNLIKSLDTQGKEGIEKISNTVGSESGEKEVTTTRDKVCRVANRIQEFKEFTGSGFSFLCADFPISVDDNFILPVAQDKILDVIFFFFELRVFLGFF